MTAYFRRVAIFVIATLTLAAPAHADVTLPQVTLKGPMTQGGLVIGETVPGARAYLDGAPLMVSPSGRFVLGFDRDHRGTAALLVELPDGTLHTRELQIARRDYDIQRIDGLPPKYVTPPPEALVRIKREAAQKRAARKRDTPAEWFAQEFVWPANGRISGVYGSQRFYNGEPRRPHYGVDVAAPTGTTVTAPAAGIVRLAEHDMYFEGGLVFIDHGHGLISVLMHMSRVDVREGQQVEQGDPVGAIGAGGRATGAHLDWRIYWRDAHVDPQLLVGPMPAATADRR